MSIENTAQAIAQHASTGPADNGQRVKNSLSPFFERLVVELIRKHIIQTIDAIKKDIGDEVTALRDLMPERSQAQVDLTWAKINAILTDALK